MKRVALLLGLWFTVGCQPGAGGLGGGGGRSFTVPITLNEIGEFEVQAGEPERRTGTINFSTTGGAAANGSFGFTPEAIQVTPAGGKNAVLLQATELVLTVFVAPIEDVDTVCESTDQYGPYTVTLDDNNVPVSIDPETVVLSENTLDLLAAGQFSICIEVLSPITGQVTIETIEVTLGS